MTKSMVAAMLLAAAISAAGAALPAPPGANPEEQVGLERPKIGDQGALFTVFFVKQSPALTAEARAILDQALAKLATGASAIEIAGHTSGVGDGGADQKLSEQRANVVRAYLVKHGVAEDRITTAGYGKTRPVDTNTTEEGRSHNRRVVVRTGAAGGS